MSTRPNLQSLDDLFSSGKDFELTDAQYEKRAGIRLPEEVSYLKSRSALAKNKADGYTIEVVEKKVCLKKVG